MVMASLLNTPQEILSILASNPDQSFFINELIRLTGKFPNSVQLALNRLYTKRLITKEKQGNRVFYQISQSVVSDVAATFRSPTAFEWVKLLNRPSFYAFNYVVCKSNRDRLHNQYGVDVASFWMNGITHGIYYRKSELEILGMAISSKLDSDPLFAERDIASCKSVSQKLLSFCNDIHGGSQKNITNTFAAFISLYEAIFPFMTSPHAIERYFETKIRNEVTNEEVLRVLLAPAVLFDEERDHALLIADYVKKNGKNKKYAKLLQEHWNLFCWLPMWTLTATPLTVEQFDREIDDIVHKIDDPENERILIRQSDSEHRSLLDRSLQSIHATETLKQQVYLLQEYINLRSYRKNVLSQAHFKVLPLLHEIAKRLSIPFDELNVLSFDEILGGLKNDIDISHLKKIAHKRLGGFGLLMWKGKIQTPSGATNMIKTMEQYRISQPIQSASTRISGRTASNGKVIGKVTVIHDLSELNKVKSGDILVTKMTTPDFVPAMSRCGGIITDEGGVTCHAAIVSREFGIPCLIATHVATQQLNDNDVVELNATKGYVKVVEAEQVDTTIKELFGKTLYKGVITGNVKVVNDFADLSEIQQGDLVVTAQVTPEYLSCLYRMGGLIVDEDSLTSHAVLYANALKIPTIMGTKIAKSFFHDGQKVSLDATKGVVKLYHS